MDFTINGRNIDLIFSVCRIKQFTDTTDCIMDEIIVFVNKVVKIIHECTKRYEGKPTKNYGDKFMLTWRLPKTSDAIDLIKAEADEDSKIGEDDMIKPDFDNSHESEKKSRRPGALSGKVIPNLVLDDSAKPLVQEKPKSEPYKIKRM